MKTTISLIKLDGKSRRIYDITSVGGIIILDNVYDPDQLWLPFDTTFIYSTKSQTVIDNTSPTVADDNQLWLPNVFEQTIYPTSYIYTALVNQNFPGWDKNENGKLYNVSIKYTNIMDNSNLPKPIVAPKKHKMVISVLNEQLLGRYVFYGHKRNHFYLSCERMTDICLLQLAYDAVPVISVLE